VDVLVLLVPVPDDHVLAPPEAHPRHVPGGEPGPRLVCETLALLQVKADVEDRLAQRPPQVPGEAELAGEIGGAAPVHVTADDPGLYAACPSGLPPRLRSGSYASVSFEGPPPAFLVLTPSFVLTVFRPPRFALVRVFAFPQGVGQRAAEVGAADYLLLHVTCR
jgi:hypothetical protein